MNVAHYLRQMDIINPNDLNFPIAIIGAGGIGSWTALTLGKLGCQNLAVFDFDTIEPQNIGCQFYSETDLGKNKVDALLERLDGVVEAQPMVSTNEITPDNAKQLLDGYGIVISAVDNIDVRRTIFDSLKGSRVNYIDGRMAADALQIFTIAMGDEESVKFYEESLFPAEEAEEMLCTAQATVYNGFVIAGFIGSMVAKLAQNQRVPREVLIDLRNYEMEN